jgi:hypothetical protein
MISMTLPSMNAFCAGGLHARVSLNIFNSLGGIGARVRAIDRRGWPSRADGRTGEAGGQKLKSSQPQIFC